jgi:hypothetical protein
LYNSGGHGLGKKEQGRLQPVEESKQISLQGLGFSSEVKKYLFAYII